MGLKTQHGKFQLMMRCFVIKNETKYKRMLFIGLL